MPFTPSDLPTYAPDIEAQILADYGARKPAWVPSEANPEVVLAGVMAYALAQVNAGLGQREIAELELIGRRRGRPRREALQAVGLARFTVAAGFVVPAATQVLVTGPGGPVTAQTIDQAGGAPGQTVIADVPVQAVIPGPDANGATGVAEVYDQFDDVIGALLTTPLGGGQAEEALDAYLDELAEFLQLFFDDPTLVNARQLAIFVRDHPQVERVLIIDLHVPAGGRLPDGTISATARDNVAGAIAAYPVTIAGESPAAFVREEIAGLVESHREAGMILGVGVPGYTAVNVAFTATVLDAPNAAAIIDAAKAAVAAYLSPATWGSPTSGDRTTHPGLWVLDRIVRYGELYALIDNVQGIDHVTSVSITGVRSYAVAAVSDVFTVAAHGLVAADQVTISAPVGGAPLAAGIYHVRDVTADTFKLAAAAGGLAVDVTADGSGNVAKVAAANTNYTLVGPAPLTRAGTITGSIG